MAAQIVPTDIECDDVGWINMAHSRFQLRVLMNTVMDFRFLLNAAICEVVERV